MLSAAVLALILASTLTWTINIRQIKANPGSITIRVRYLDGCPRYNAEVHVKNSTHTYTLGLTDENGTITRSDLGLSSGTYQALAYYPEWPTQFGPTMPFEVNATGDGVATIEEDFEITPPAVEIFSPQNVSYAVSSVDLSFTVNDYSSISWMGYSLDGQSNVTVAGNTSLTGLSLGQHNVIVYANDTYGNMGSSDLVYFTRILGCVTIKAQYKDGYPRPNAYVCWRNTTQWYDFGLTNASGIKKRCNYLSPGFYEVSAWYPDFGTQFGRTKGLTVDADGYGSQTITADYEISPPVIEVLSPVNMTFTNASLSLSFTVYDFSPISWIGYSLDNQANVTVTGNTTLTNLPIGQHSIIVYANDTYGNMGYSDKIYFTIANDIAITNVTTTKTIIGQGYTTTINVTIENQGATEVTFNVTAYANTTVIDTVTNITLTNGTTTTITFTWNTTGFSKGNYTIKAYAWPVIGETDTLDNTKTADNEVKIGVPGDLNNDGKCNILDLVIEAGKFGSVKGDPDPNKPKYDPNYDFNDDGKINILDLVKLAGHFGTTDP